MIKQMRIYVEREREREREAQINASFQSFISWLEFNRFLIRSTYKTHFAHLCLCNNYVKFLHTAKDVPP